MTHAHTKSTRGVLIFDTTLRDGEQSPGAAMTLEQKLQVAKMLDALRVDIIEAGFPAASPGDFLAVSEIAKLVKNATVCALARAGEMDIERAAEAVRHAAQPRIHTFISTSPVHMKYKLCMSPQAVLEAIRASVTLARRFTDDVQWSAEDATRTEPDFLRRCVESAIKSGATTINIPDTVGYATPWEYARLIRMLRESVPCADDVVFSTHCHNDLGMAVANSLAGVLGSARQVECTINGIGERAGNAALEEVVMALRVRGNDELPYTTDVDATLLAKASKLVSSVTGFPVQYNKAIVGRNAFSHESGIHQDGMLKNVETYEIMRPGDVGVKESSLVLGKLSGRHAFREKTAALGYALDDAALAAAFSRFKALADVKKGLFDEDIIALVEDSMPTGALCTLEHLHYEGGEETPPYASIRFLRDGTSYEGGSGARGDGPIDAVFKAIMNAYPHEAEARVALEPVTEGGDALGRIRVSLTSAGHTVIGTAVNSDIIKAAAHAYLKALAKIPLHANAARLTDPPAAA